MLLKILNLNVYFQSENPNKYSMNYLKNYKKCLKSIRTRDWFLKQLVCISALNHLQLDRSLIVAFCLIFEDKEKIPTEPQQHSKKTHYFQSLPCWRWSYLVLQEKKLLWRGPKVQVTNKTASVFSAIVWFVVDVGVAWVGCV